MATQATTHCPSCRVGETLNGFGAVARPLVRSKDHTQSDGMLRLCDGIVQLINHVNQLS